jgi:hypothetical protein
VNGEKSDLNKVDRNKKDVDGIDIEDPCVVIDKKKNRK